MDLALLALSSEMTNHVDYTMIRKHLTRIGSSLTKAQNSTVAGASF